MIRWSLLTTRQRHRRHRRHVHFHLSLRSCHWHRHHVSRSRVEASAGVVLLLLGLRTFDDVLRITSVCCPLLRLEVRAASHVATHVLIVAHLIVLVATALICTSPRGSWLVHLVLHRWLERAVHVHAAHWGSLRGPASSSPWDKD